MYVGCEGYHVCPDPREELQICNPDLKKLTFIFDRKVSKGTVYLRSHS